MTRIPSRNWGGAMTKKRKKEQGGHAVGARKEEAAAKTKMGLEVLVLHGGETRFAVWKNSPVGMWARCRMLAAHVAALVATPPTILTCHRPRRLLQPRPYWNS